MIGLPIPNGFIDLASIDFKCPHCGKVYSDLDDKYLNRVNRNKYGYTKIRCECGHWFGMTYNFKSEAIGFKLEKGIALGMAEIDRLERKEENK